MQGFFWSVMIICVGGCFYCDNHDITIITCWTKKITHQDVQDGTSSKKPSNIATEGIECVEELKYN